METEVERQLIEFIGRDGTAAEQLTAIPAGRRNHARDACGVGCSRRCGRSR
jgi:hypothetical protein